jgi:hypothetical protein
MRRLVVSTMMVLMMSLAVQAEVKVNKVSAYLIGGRTGALSKDVLAVKDFAFWNTVIGEGDAHEPADDVLVTVNLKLSEAGEKFGDISLTAREKDGKKVLGSRTDVNPSFLDGTDGAASFVLYNVTCRNLNIEVRSGKKLLKTTNIPFACGE